ncbi:hypothetical protein MKW92_008811 [Papaver armeniacum]|nr:hypothetical protein MKW92_008811 [Papaver armeniacum]
MMIPTTWRIDASRTTDLVLEKDENLEKVTKAAEYGISTLDDNEKKNFTEERLLINFNDDMYEKHGFRANSQQSSFPPWKILLLGPQRSIGSI